MLSPSSILPPPTSHYARKKEFGARLKNIIIIILSLSKKERKSDIELLEISKSGSVCLSVCITLFV
jgi:hypothetical protein